MSQTQTTIRPIRVYEAGGQLIMVLLASLLDLSDRIPSKREVEHHVEKCGYLKLTAELTNQAYDSKAEPKWKTLLAFARENAIDRGLLKHLTRRDAWEISDKGKERFAKLEQQFKDGEFDIKRFTLLSATFLKRMAHTGEK